MLYLFILIFSAATFGAALVTLGLLCCWFKLLYVGKHAILQYDRNLASMHAKMIKSMLIPMAIVSGCCGILLVVLNIISQLI